jgi:hypothetical protein
MVHKKQEFRSRKDRRTGKVVRYPIVSEMDLIQAATEVADKPKSLDELHLDAALELLDTRKASKKQLQEAAEYVVNSTLASDEEKNFANSLLIELAEEEVEKESLEIAKEEVQHPGIEVPGLVTPTDALPEGKNDIERLLLSKDKSADQLAYLQRVADIATGVANPRTPQEASDATDFTNASRELRHLATISGLQFDARKLRLLPNREDITSGARTALLKADVTARKAIRGAETAAGRGITAGLRDLYHIVRGRDEEPPVSTAQISDMSTAQLDRVIRKAERGEDEYSFTPGYSTKPGETALLGNESILGDSGQSIFGGEEESDEAARLERKADQLERKNAALVRLRAAKKRLKALKRRKKETEDDEDTASHSLIGSEPLI